MYVASTSRYQVNSMKNMFVPAIELRLYGSRTTTVVADPVTVKHSDSKVVTLSGGAPPRLVRA